MGSSLSHCCGSVAQLVGGRRRDDRPGGPPPRPQGPPQEPSPGSPARPEPPASPDDVATLEAQAARLRSSIARRRSVAGCSNDTDNVSGISNHYERTLERTEQQLRAARSLQEKAAPPADPAHARTYSGTGSTTGSSARS
ncbi:unnamed protein product [Prorocentrum cordatum]|uniref:Uncharacterized protein n=1 Tax=Prorocentrum cordatum TaxID=2364126 RepID=A0ABN9S6K2_9DINO|nr:unnamed protein product [Polarella glacialis]